MSKVITTVITMVRPTAKPPLVEQIFMVELLSMERGLPLSRWCRTILRSTAPVSSMEALRSIFRFRQAAAHLRTSSLILNLRVPANYSPRHPTFRACTYAIRSSQRDVKESWHSIASTSPGNTWPLEHGSSGHVLPGE